MIIRNMVFILFATTFSIAIAMDQSEDYQEKDNAARTLQRHIRNNEFRNKTFQDMYKQGLEYRDGKVKGYEKDSIFSKSPAGIHFFPLAWEGDAKAQHNLGMIYYAHGNYEEAYTWLEKASNQGLQPSIKNLEILTTEMKRALLRLPSVSLDCISSFLDNLSLLTLRRTSLSAAQIVDQEFFTRAEIKTPLACLTSDVKTHPFPSTVSYFLRKRLWQIPSTQPDNAKQRSPIFAKCLNFSKDWGYPGMNLFNYATALKEHASLGGSIYHVISIDNPDQMESTDTRELNLYQFSHSNTNGSPHPTETLESFLNGASKMIDLGEAEIAIYYLMNYGNYCFKIKNYKDAKLSFKKAADAKYFNALVRYGDTLLEEIKIEKNIKIKEEKQKEMMACYRAAADNGNKHGQYNLACVLGTTEEAKHYYKKAIDQGHPYALHNLNYILKQESEKERESR